MGYYDQIEGQLKCQRSADSKVYWQSNGKVNVCN